MQPYFAPYAGYFRLFTAADLFVVYDCVQFPRRGWVHRNRLPNAIGEAKWLTLHLEKAPVEATIQDLRLAGDAPGRLATEVRRFPSLAKNTTLQTLLQQHLAPTMRVVDYLEALLGSFREMLGLGVASVRSSSLAIDPSLRGQDRILAIVQRVGGNRYVNAPGGRALYDTEHFARAGVTLEFLKPWSGSNWSVLHELATRPARAVADDITLQTCFDA
jgi:WbqC-like protein family